MSFDMLDGKYGVPHFKYRSKIGILASFTKIATSKTESINLYIM